MQKTTIVSLFLVASSAQAGEKSISKSSYTEKARIELGQAFATGSDADIWGQSSVSITIDPPLQLRDVKVDSLGAGVEGASHSDANFLNSYFDQGPHALEFEVQKDSSLNWTTSKHECFLKTAIKVKIINESVFRLVGFGGKEFDAYGSTNYLSEKITWERCLELLRSDQNSVD